MSSVAMSEEAGGLNDGESPLDCVYICLEDVGVDGGGVFDVLMNPSTFGVTSTWARTCAFTVVGVAVQEKTDLLALDACVPRGGLRGEDLLRGPGTNKMAVAPGKRSDK